MNSTISQRYHGLDLLRAVAMLLGVAIHAPLVYFSPELKMGFDLGEVPEAEIWVQLMVGFIHQWRMPTFFLLAGFFAALVLNKRGAGHYTRDRLVRIGLALLIFMIPYDLLDGRLDGTLMHLWFLYYLLPMCLIAALIWRLRLPVGLLAWPARRVWTWPVYLALLVPLGIAAVGADFGQEIPERIGQFELVPFLYFATYFALGAALYASRDVLGRLARWRVIGPLFVFGIALMLANFDGLTALGPVATLALTLSMLGFAHRMLRRPSPRVDWLIELSYPVYVFHAMPAMFLGAAFVTFGLPQVLAIPLNIVLSFLFSVLAYYVLVKFTPLNWVMNGYKRSWFRWPGRPAAASRT